MLAAGLRPLAQPDRHPDAFYRGWRLVGVDGTEASVTNTPGNQKLPKAGSRRGKAAFAKLKLVTAVELGLHNPLAAQTGTLRDYEVTLALRCGRACRAHSLVIVDRLYGVAQHVGDIIAASVDRDLALLVRARGRVQARVQRRLADGSTLVQISPARRPGRPASAPITVREIRAAVARARRTPAVVVRLWTTLLDPVAYPARELVELYAQRWEHELAYRELKLDVRRGDVLDSHTAHTALQELAAVVLAMACVAHVRAAATAPLERPPGASACASSCSRRSRCGTPLPWAVPASPPNRRPICSTPTSPDSNARPSCPSADLATARAPCVSPSVVGRVCGDAPSPLAPSPSKSRDNLTGIEPNAVGNHKLPDESIRLGR